MEFSVDQIAGLIGGKVIGDGSIKIKMLAKIQEAQNHEVTFLSNPKYEPNLYTTQAGAVIVSEGFEPKSAHNATLIVVKDAYVGVTKLLEEYHKIISSQQVGVEEPNFMHDSSSMEENGYRGAFSYIGKNVKIGKGVKIFPQVYIGDNSVIGDYSVLHPGVKVYANTTIKNHCIVHSGAVIGSDGFGFAPQSDGSYKAIPQMGGVLLEENVSVGANTVIDCATFYGDKTVIGQGVKLDNLVQIAHNVVIGKNTVVAAQTGISGSTTVGENCVFAGQVGVIGHAKIANNSTFGGKAGVIKGIKKEGEIHYGNPSFDVKQYLKSYAVFKKLPEFDAKLKQLEEKIINLPTV